MSKLPVNAVSLPKAIEEELVSGQLREHFERAENGTMLMKYDELLISKSKTQKGMLAIEVRHQNVPLATVFVENALETGQTVVLHGMKGTFGVHLG